MSVPKDHQAMRPAAEPGSSTLRPDTVYRLRGVPQRFQRSDIPDLLRNAFGETDGFPVEVGSLAQSPTRVGEKVATVTLPDASRVLSRININKDREQEWPLNVDLREGIVGLRLDTHFYGLTPLHDGDDAGCTRDIIAISGLNGHAFGSFKQRGGPWMWLRDGLPNDLPNTRIFTYSYDTQLQGSLSIQNLTDVGISLRAALNDFFQTVNVMVAATAPKVMEGLTQTAQAASRPRPLLFIAHSLGGLVIKEAFLHMKDPMYAKIVEAACGFFFFGVPTLGMAIESLVPMIGNQPNRSFLETLGRDSALLRCHQEQFWAVFRSSPVQILGFYETKLSRTACDVNGVWKMQGPKALLVDFASATVGSHQYHPIDQDHSDMVKFNNVDDSNYRAVLSYVRQLNYGSIPLMQVHTAPLSKDDKACLSSLAFPGQDWHRDGVVSVDGTCDWIFSHDIFKDWDTDPTQLLWIRGNPGTGKSTMMKHIFQLLDERKPQGQTLATFFFNARAGGNEPLTTPLSLYKALLNQILHQSPEYLSELTSKFKAYEDARNKSWKWSVDELRRHFATVVPAISAKRHICILVDALDESGEDNARELIGQFQETLAAVNKIGGVLKICFSCRHFPILTLKDGLTVTMETENRKDIEIFVQKRLQPFGRDASVLEKAILQKAEGVFQWAKLVTNQALDLRIRGQKVERILLRIKRIPKQLEELYESLLSWPDQDEEQEDRRQALELFQWMLFAAEPVTLAQVRFVLDIDEQMKDTPMQEYLEDVGSMEEDDRVRRAVRTLSRGLVEFRLQWNPGYSKYVHVLQPIHQTIREYLLEKGLRQLQYSTIEGPLASPHYQIFKTSVKFLFLEGVLEDSLADNECLAEFLCYSLTHLGYHFLETDQNEVDPEELLDLFQWPLKSQMILEWRKYLADNLEDVTYGLHRVKNHGVDKARWEYRDWPMIEGSTLLHLAAFVGHTGILESAIKRDNDHYLHAEDEMSWTPLSIAVGRGHEDFAIRILSRNQDFEVKAIEGNAIDHHYDRGWTTITHAAARFGLTGVLGKLLEVGVDVDGPEDFQPSPLLSAACERQLETCRMLLNHQANPDVPWSYLGTPLSVAIQILDEELSCLLVQNRDGQSNRSPAPTRANVYNALWPCSVYEDAEWRDPEQLADIVFEKISSKLHGDFIRKVLGPISTPLHDACARGNTKVASFLIDKAGFDINGTDCEGRTPIFRAVQEEQHDMIEWLFRNYHVRYLSGDDWSQLPERTTAKKTYRQMVENGGGRRGFPLSQQRGRQRALKALEDSQNCKEPEMGDDSYPQGPVEFERDHFSFRRLYAATMRKIKRKEEI